MYDLSKGICIFNNNTHVNARNIPLHKLNHTDRSPTQNIIMLKQC